MSVVINMGKGIQIQGEAAGVRAVSSFLLTDLGQPWGALAPTQPTPQGACTLTLAPGRRTRLCRFYTWSCSLRLKCLVRLLFTTIKNKTHYYNW